MEERNPQRKSPRRLVDNFSKKISPFELPEEIKKTQELALYTYQIVKINHLNPIPIVVKGLNQRGEIADVSAELFLPVGIDWLRQKILFRTVGGITKEVLITNYYESAGFFNSAAPQPKMISRESLETKTNYIENILKTYRRRPNP